MADPAGLLERLRRGGVEVWLESGCLHYWTPADCTEKGALLEQLRRQKPEIIRLLEENAHPLEARARKLLGLDDCGQYYLPMRVEEMWRSEMALYGAAPKIPFDLNYSKVFRSPIDVGALKQAAAIVISRHTALRSRIGVYRGRPVQIVDETQRDIKVVQLGASLLTRSGELTAAIRELVSPPIDPELEQAFRCRLFKDSEGNAGLALVMHHYFCDHWSVQTISKEIEEAYSDLAGNRTSELKPIQVQYVSYPAIQRTRLLRKLPKVLDFWQRELGNFEPFSLPRRVLRNDHRMKPLYYVLEKDLVQNVRHHALAAGVGLASILLSAYQIALGKWSGSNSVANAVSIADRFDASLASTVGYLINAVLLPSKLDGHTVCSLAQDIDYRLRLLKRDQELSYELCERIFEPPAPFCSTLFNYIPMDRVTPKPEALSPSKDIMVLSGPSFKRQMHHRDLYFELVELAVGLRGRIFFNMDYFEQTTIEEFIMCYRDILATGISK